MKMQNSSIARKIPLWVSSSGSRSHEQRMIDSFMERLHAAEVHDDICDHAKSTLMRLLGLQTPGDDNVQDQKASDDTQTDDETLAGISSGSIQQYVSSVMERVREVLSWKILDDVDTLVVIVLTASFEVMAEQDTFNVETMMGYITSAFDQIASMDDAPKIANIKVLLFVIQESLEKISTIINAVQE